MGKKRKRPIKDAIQPRDSRSCASPKSKHEGMTGHSHPVISLYYPQVLTLRQYLLQQIPVSSKSRRRRIASVRADGSDAETEGDHGLANLLDRTLVGVSKESPPTSTPENRRELARFSQSQSRSVEDSNVGPVCAQTEVSLTLIHFHSLMSMNMLLSISCACTTIDISLRLLSYGLNLY